MAYTTVDNPELYFQTKLYTGNGGTNAITLDGSENMQPNWVWIKDRGQSGYNHNIFDSVRGATKLIWSNLTNAEGTYANSLTAFNSDGFTLGADSNGEANGNSNSYVAWNWKAGTSVSGTTSGSGTGKAYTGSVSTDAGFSIIGYIGNGTANHTLPHHLGVVPKMLIIKNRTSSGYEWSIYHHTLGNEKRMFLNDTSAAGSSTAYWNNISPTSSVINLGGGGAVNENNSNMIAYCFAEKQGYSKFGSYTGTEAADGAFVHLGFRPAYVLQKNSAYTGNWQIYDNKRPGFNATDNHISANISDAEVTDNSNSTMDLCANGFKLKGVDNASSNWSNLYIYMAFAENPFVTSTGVPATAR